MVRELTLHDVQSMAPNISESDAQRIIRALMGAHPRELSGEEWLALCERVSAESSGRNGA